MSRHSEVKPASVVGVFLLALAALASAEQTDEQPQKTQIDPPSLTLQTSTIESETFHDVSGVMQVNLTAGDNNLQQNSTAFAESNGLSVAGVKTQQLNQRQAINPHDVLSAQIEGEAFNGALGIMMVNQSAGVSNSQVNGAALAIGDLGAIAFTQMDDAMLSDSSAGNGIDGELQQHIAPKATIDPDAFKDSRGLILINQTAGNNNRTSNSFTMSVNR